MTVSREDGPGRCRLFHRWRKHLRVNDAPMALDPLVGYRVCERCGKRQRYYYDSQGGCWVTEPAPPSAVPLCPRCEGKGVVPNERGVTVRCTYYDEMRALGHKAAVVGGEETVR